MQHRVERQCIEGHSSTTNEPKFPTITPHFSLLRAQVIQEHTPGSTVSPAEYFARYLPALDDYPNSDRFIHTRRRAKQCREPACTALGELTKITVVWPSILTISTEGMFVVDNQSLDTAS